MEYWATVWEQLVGANMSRIATTHLSQIATSFLFHLKRTWRSWFLAMSSRTWTRQSWGERCCNLVRLTICLDKLAFPICHVVDPTIMNLPTSTKNALPSSDWVGPHNGTFSLSAVGPAFRKSYSLTAKPWSQAPCSQESHDPRWSNQRHAQQLLSRILAARMPESTWWLKYWNLPGDALRLGHQRSFSKWATNGRTLHSQRPKEYFPRHHREEYGSSRWHNRKEYFQK